MIHFFLMVNKHGQTRLADYFGPKCAPRESARQGCTLARQRLRWAVRWVICDRLVLTRLPACAGWRGRPWSRGQRRRRRLCGNASRGRTTRCAPCATSRRRLFAPLTSRPVRDLCQCSFFEHQGKNIMYRRYASLFFIVGTTEEVRHDPRLHRLLPTACPACPAPSGRMVL